MKHRLLFALLALAFAAPAHSAVLQADSKSYPVTAKHRVRLEFPVGDLKVVANDDTHVRLSLQVKCRGNEDRCEERARRLKLESDDAGGVLSLKVTGYPKYNSGGFNLQGTLQVPRALALRLEMGVGALSIDGVEGNLDVDLGVGEADISAPRHSVRSVSVQTGVGDAEIRNAGTKSASHGFIGRTASWDAGTGGSRVDLHVGVGDATVRLD